MNSIPVGGYGMVSRRVMRMPGVSKEAKAVHALLCSYTGDKDYCYPTVETLAKDLETSERSIIRWTEELKAKGLVDKVKLPGNQRRTAYIPLFPDLLKGDSSDTNQAKDATPDTISALNHDTGDIITGDTDGTLILTGNTNTSENINTKREPADDNPLSKPRLKSNASALCSEAMDAFNSQILKRKAQPDYTMWPAWVALAGDEQAAFETVMGIIYASKIPDGPRLPFQLDGVFRDPARAAYWRAQYKPTKSEHEWLESGDQERIISTVARILKNNGTVPKEAESWIPQAQQRLTKHLVA